jgi:signal transduction histidine kinase
VHDHRTLPRFLLEISLPAQLFICVLASLLCIIVAVLLSPTSQNLVIFVIPIGLASWIFQRKGLTLSIFVFVLIYAAKVPIFPLSLAKTAYFILGALALIFIGLLICWQRDAFELADEAQYQISLSYEQQRKLHQIKDQFIQNVNHELRTPLTAIYGYLELLLEHEEQLDVEMRKLFLEHAMQSCDELQLLVNNVLDSMSETRERRRKLFVEEVPVFDVVSEVLERFDPKTLLEHPVSVHIADYIVVMANPQYVRQIIRNLLSNAFKYCPIASPIIISARLYRDLVDPYHPSPEICITIEDRGPGIPADEIPLLFGQFVRLPRDTSGHIRGSGLGLYISKQFVEAMEGHIWVESEGIPGKGATFSFTLPCVVRPYVKARKQNIQIPTL